MYIALVFVSILILSGLGGWFFSRKGNNDEETKQTRILKFILFFWLLVFVQTIVVGLLYALYTP